MGLRGTVYALVYERMGDRVERAGLAALRRRLLAGAGGSVLEIGAGTGANLPHYDPAVGSLTLTEPEAPMLRRLERRAAGAAPQARLVRAPAGDLPFADDSFDTAVLTLVLCGVGDQDRALAEVRRVLRPGGRLLFIEHVRADDPGLARRQDRLNRLNRVFTRCDCNRRTLDAIRAAGFEVATVERPELPMLPSLVRPLVMGTATAP